MPQTLWWIQSSCGSWCSFVVYFICFTGMCVCMTLCMYVCMHDIVFVCVYAWHCVCVYAWHCVCMCVCMRLCMHNIVYVCMILCMYVCMCNMFPLSFRYLLFMTRYHQLTKKVLLSMYLPCSSQMALSLEISGVNVCVYV